MITESEGNAGADPGFPRESGAKPKGGAAVLFGHILPKTA